MCIVRCFEKYKLNEDYYIDLLLCSILLPGIIPKSLSEPLLILEYFCELPGILGLTYLLTAGPPHAHPFFRSDGGI
jgi:hypothetical protein